MHLRCWWFSRSRSTTSRRACPSPSRCTTPRATRRAAAARPPSLLSEWWHGQNARIQSRQENGWGKPSTECPSLLRNGTARLQEHNHAQSESAGPKNTWRQAVATLGRPHCQECFGSARTCGFTLSMGRQEYKKTGEGSLVRGDTPGTRPNISESHSEISTRVPFCIGSLVS